MGLTIHYGLHCNGSIEQARHAVEQLYHRAVDLPFEEVSPVVEFSGDECSFENREQDDPHRWLLIQPRQLLDPGFIEVRPTKVIAFSA